MSNSIKSAIDSRPASSEPALREPSERFTPAERFQEFTRVSDAYRHNKQCMDECNRVIRTLEVEHDYTFGGESSYAIVLRALADWYGYRVAATKERRAIEIYLGIILGAAVRYPSRLKVQKKHRSPRPGSRFPIVQP